MPTRNLEKNNWETYFDRASRNLRTSSIHLEVGGLDLGNQIEADNLPLEGFSYDPNDDSFYIICQGLEHQIRHPRQINVQEDGLGLKAVEIIDEEDHKHVATLTEALQLPQGDQRPRR